MGYQLRTRWLEWHNFTPMPDIESLKRQIDVIQREIDGREEALDALARIGKRPPQDVADLQALREVLATLERLLPPF